MRRPTCPARAWVVAVFISSLQGCSAYNFIPLIIGEDFAIPFGGTDLLRGVKLSRSDAESPFKEKPFDATIIDRPFTTEYLFSNTLTTEQDMDDYLGVEGTISVTFGPASAEGGGAFYDKYAGSSKRIKVVYTRRSAAYAKSVDLETISMSQALTDFCQGPCKDDMTGDIGNHFGTYFIDQIVYGAQIDFEFEITTSEDIDLMDIAAELKGKVDLVVIEAKFDADFAMTSDDSFSRYQIDVSCQASGVNFAVPSNPTLEQVYGIIEDFNAAYADIIESLGSGNSIYEEPNELKTLAPIGYTVAAIEDHLPVINEMMVRTFDMKMVDLGRTLKHTLSQRAQLRIAFEAVENNYAAGNPRFRDELFLPYQVEVGKMMDKMNDIIEECLEYRKQPLETIIVTTPPKGLGQGTDEENKINDAILHALKGKGYIGPPVRFEDDTPIDLDIYYTGYALPHNDSEFGVHLRPQFVGAVFNNTDEEFLASGITKNEIYDNYIEALPSELPPNQIGYRTPFVIQVKDMFASIRADVKQEKIFAQTHFAEDFCTETRSSTELQFLARPEDIFEQDEYEKSNTDCLQWGAEVYIARADEKVGDVFLRPGSGKNRANMEFQDVMTNPGEGFKFKIQSSIPFDGQFDSLVQDAKVGECVDITTGFNIFLQNDYPMRWLAGANADEKARASKKKSSRVEDKSLTSTLKRTGDVNAKKKDSSGDKIVEMPEEDFDDMWTENIFVDEQEKDFDMEQYKWKILSFDTAWADSECKAKEVPPKRRRRKKKTDELVKASLGFAAGSGLELDSKPGFKKGVLKDTSVLGGLVGSEKAKGLVGSEKAKGLPTSSIKDYTTRAYSKSQIYKKKKLTAGLCIAKHGLQSTLTGIDCSGGVPKKRSCDRLDIHCNNNGRLKIVGDPVETKNFVQGQKAFCPQGSVVTGLGCIGSCARLRLQCHELKGVALPKLSSKRCGSESVANGPRNIPKGTFLVGVECSTGACRNKILHFCRPEETTTALPTTGQQNSGPKKVTKAAALEVNRDDDEKDSAAQEEAKEAETRIGATGSRINVGGLKGV